MTGKDDEVPDPHLTTVMLLVATMAVAAVAEQLPPTGIPLRQMPDAPQGAGR